MRDFILKILFLSMLSVSITSYGQDYHFSQYYSSPLSLNPALTGNFTEDIRGSAIYRSQWQGINATYETTSLGVDMNFKGGVLKKDMIGVGLYVYKDNLGNNLLTGQSLVLSGAYHHALDVYRRHRISGGFQTGYVQKSIDASKLAFADQYEDFELVPGLASGDVLVKNQLSYLTINLGAFYSFRVNPRTDLFTGVSLFQVNRPKESFLLSETSKRLNTRFSTFSGVNYVLNAQLTISPRVLYMNQGNSMDINPGAALEYKMGKQKQASVSLGGWYRVNDAAIIMGGAKWENYTLRVSYDATVSKLTDIKNASNMKSNPKTGAFEISLIVTGKLSRAVPDYYTVPCTIL